MRTHTRTHQVWPHTGCTRLLRHSHSQTLPCALRDPPPASTFLGCPTVFPPLAATSTQSHTCLCPQAHTHMQAHLLTKPQFGGKESHGHQHARVPPPHKAHNHTPACTPMYTHMHISLCPYSDIHSPVFSRLKDTGFGNVCVSGGALPAPSLHMPTGLHASTALPTLSTYLPLSALSRTCHIETLHQHALPHT